MTSEPTILRPGRLLRWAWWLVLVLPVFMLIAGQKYTVNVPKWDDWPIVGEPLAEHVQSKLDASDFFDQVVDNRMPVSRVVFFGLALASRWDARAHTLATWVFGMLSLAALMVLVRRTWPDDPFKRFFMVAASGVLIFTPTGWMLWTFCPFMANTLMLAMTLWCLVLATWAKPVFSPALAGAMVLAALASWIYLSGWLAWGLLLWAVLSWLLRFPGSGRRVAMVWVGCLLVMAGMAVVYFDGYVFEGKPGLGRRLLSDPLSIPLFFVRWLGAPFGDLASLAGDETRIATDRVASAAVGIFGLAAFFRVSFTLARDKRLRLFAWPWWAITGWGLAAGGLVTLGRIELNENAAFWPRYQLFSVMVWIGLLALILISRSHGALGVRIGRGSVVLLFGGGLVAGSVGAYEDMRGDYLVSLNVRGGLQMLHVAPTALPLHRIWPGHLDDVRRLVEILEPAGFLAPGTLKSSRVKDASLITENPRIEGEILSAGVAESGAFSAKGWAFDKMKLRPVDAIVLSVERPGEDEKWFALATKFSDGKKLAAQRKLRGRFARIAWSYMELPPGLPHAHARIVPLPSPPSPGSIVRAYALDTDSLDFTRLQGEIVIP